MTDSVVTATGVPVTPGSNGSVPLRREIRDLQANFKDQWNVYLLGLADLQKQPLTDILSYYNLAGIHGEPFVPWNGVNGDENATFGGYCTHSSILFLTWHRPYLAVYEQALYASVQNVANQFPDSLRAKYVAAAKDFRAPYWDWATKISGQTSAFPAVISSSTATVVDIDGKTKQIDNPLYSFRFDDKDIPQELSLDSSWTQLPNTVRAPNSSGTSQNALVSRVITNEAASLRNNVSLVLLSYKQFDAFSNNAWLRNGTPGHYGSIEDLHNEIHDKVGQGGHMGSLEVSAFDPVFWLHHTNVDRLWAIWQAMNPNAYVINKVAQAQEANFTITAGEPINANTELRPFYNASGTDFWNSTGVKWTDPFGHAYPETQKWLYPNDQAYQAAVRSQVTKLYGGNVINNFFENIASIPAAAKASVASAAAPSAGTRDISTASTSTPATSSSAPEHKHTLNVDFVKHAVAHPVEAAKEVLAHRHHPNAPAANTHADGHAPAPSAPHAENASTPQAAVAHQAAAPAPAQAPLNPSTPVSLNVPEQFTHLVPNRTYTEWITNLRAVKHGLNQTFRVYVFLGEFNPDPASWPTEYNVVGRFTVLGRGSASPCSKCTSDRSQDLIVTGTVPLTSALLQDIVQGRLASLEPADVEPFLEKNLHWRVTVFDGSEVNREEVPGLKVSVVSTKVRIGNDGVPIYSEDYVEYRGITDGRPGGLGHGDDV